MMKVVDMLGRFPIFRISRLGTSNPKQVGGGFKGPFCALTVGVPKNDLMTYFVWEVVLPGKNIHLKNYQKISCRK